MHWDLLAWIKGLFKILNVFIKVKVWRKHTHTYSLINTSAQLMGILKIYIYLHTWIWEHCTLPWLIYEALSLRGINVLLGLLRISLIAQKYAVCTFKNMSLSKFLIFSWDTWHAAHCLKCEKYLIYVLVTIQ